MAGHQLCGELIRRSTDLPRPSVFAAAVIERARGLLRPPANGVLLGAPPIDERSFAKCMERAMLHGTDSQVLAALQNLHQEARNARLYQSAKKSSGGES